jgi:poly-gamma-glutamate synthesis protein (capsule biosynthesis protein)
MFLGDVNIGGDVTRAAGEHPPGWFWGDALPLLQDVDAAIGNLECPVTVREAPWDETFKAVLMRADPGALPILSAANVRAVALANNHTLDRRREGLMDTLAHLDDAGIAAAGAGADSAAAQRPAIFDAGGVRMALLSATDNMPWYGASSTRAGLNHLNIYNREVVYRRLERWVADARGQGAEIVVLSLHWGPNYRLMPPRRFQRFARAAIDRGVTIVHGHSAHVVQPVERHGDGLILYDTGDALDDYWQFLGYSNNWSYLFEIAFESNLPPGLRLWPISLHRSPPIRRATVEEARRMNGRLMRRSRRFGTGFQEQPDGSLQLA